MAARVEERDLWWAEGAGLVSGAVLATGLGELGREPLWRGALLVALAGALRLASFAVWRRLRRVGEGSRAASAPASAPPPSTGTGVEPTDLARDEPVTAGPLANRVSPPAAGHQLPVEVPTPASAIQLLSPEPDEIALAGTSPAGSEWMVPAAHAPGRERLAELWHTCLREGEGRFDAPALGRALTASGLGGKVLGEAPARNLFAVELSLGAGRVFLLPLPGITVRAVAEWFFSPGSEGSRLARIQRLVRPAVARRGAAGWELVEKGVVE